MHTYAYTHAYVGTHISLCIQDRERNRERQEILSSGDGEDSVESIYSTGDKYIEFIVVAYFFIFYVFSTRVCKCHDERSLPAMYLKQVRIQNRLSTFIC